MVERHLQSLPRMATCELWSGCCRRKRSVQLSVKAQQYGWQRAMGISPYWNCCWLTLVLIRDAYNSAVRMASHRGHLHVVTRLLQDKRVDPGAGGQAALALAAREGHIDVLHALLEDPRVDAEAYLNSYLASDGKALPLLSRQALLRRPAVVRALLAKPEGAADRFPLPAAFGRAEMRGWAAAAWRRRRAAMLAWFEELL